MSDYEGTEELQSENETEEIVIETKSKPKAKRVMSEKQREALAKARVLAHAKRKEMGEIKKKEKEIKSEGHLIKKLELQKKIFDHENHKKKLLLEAGLAPTPVRKYKKKEDLEDLEDQNEKNEIEALEKKIAELKVSKVSKKSKKKVIEPETESEVEDFESSESESSEEEIIKKPVKKPNPKLDLKEPPKPKRKEVIKMKSPMVNTNDPEIIKNLAQLFPDFKF